MYGGIRQFLVPSVMKSDNHCLNKALNFSVLYFEQKISKLITLCSFKKISTSINFLYCLGMTKVLFFI